MEMFISWEFYSEEVGTKSFGVLDTDLMATTHEHLARFDYIAPSLPPTPLCFGGRKPR